jgi:maleylacetate reductase
MSDSFWYPTPPQRVLFAAGGVGRVHEELGALGVERALLIGNPARLARHGVTTALGGVVSASWDEIPAHVPAEVVNAAERVARDAAVDGIVAVGGGSAVGLAKALALALDVPFLAVPTTYAGSEMTSIYGVTKGSVKTTGLDDRVRPQTVIYDPNLTLDLPRLQTAVSGLNAIAHCIESLYAEQATAVTEAVALTGLCHLAAGLPAACADGGDLTARSQCLYGAHLAGIALTAGAGLHHRVCHAIGGNSRASHGAIHAVMLPHVAAFNAPAAPAAMRQLAEVLGDDDVSGALYDLAVELGAPTSLAAIGVEEAALEQIAEATVRSPVKNPRPVDADEVVELLASAYRGERPVAVAHAVAQ